MHFLALAFALSASPWIIENDDVDVAAETLQGDNVIHVTTYNTGHTGVSALSRRSAVPYRNSRVRLSTRLRMDTDSFGGSAYVIVKAGARASVFHAEILAPSSDGWGTVTVFADVPTDAEELTFGLWIEEGLLARPGWHKQNTSAWFRAIAVEQFALAPLSPKADFVLRPYARTGTHITRPIWMRADSSRVIADGSPTSFLSASLVERNVAYLQRTRYD